MLAEVAVEALAAVITGTGRWLATSARSGLRARSVRHEAEIASWFDTDELTTGPFPEPPAAVGPYTAARWLRSNATHAVLHELLAVRMTAGPETDVERLRAVLRGGADGVDPDWADAVFDWADEAVRELVVRLESRNPASWRAARDDAFSARIVAVLGAIERHIAAVTAVPDGADDAAWTTRYRWQALQAYGSIEPPDFSRRRKVPIADLYVPPDITVPGAPPNPDDTPRTVAFDQLVAAIDRTVLLGDPGGGKSTASQVIAHRWASDPAAHVPFLVVLRDFAPTDSPARSVVEHIEDRLKAFHQCPPPPGAVERLLLSGDAAVIFDGLDELIDTASRLEVTRTIEQFCAQYPLAPVLVTSRLVGYDEAGLDERQFRRYTIAGFDERRARDYVRRWFAQDADVPDGYAEQLADAFMKESDTVADLRSSPLMLSYMCVLYRGAGTLPRDRPAVYEQCTRLLLDTWDARRRIKVDLRARNHIEPALRDIAYWLFTQGGDPEVTEQELIAHTTDYLHQNAFERRVDAYAAAQEFIVFCRGRAWILSDAGTTVHGGHLYRFTHRTFLEYLAAYHLAGLSDTPERLARRLVPRVARAEWEVVAQLAVQIKSRAQARGAERIYTALLGEKRRRSVAGRANVLRFLARCLEFVEPPPAVVRNLARTVLDHFTGGDPDDPSRYEPLLCLLAYADGWRDMVAEEVTRAADRAVAAGGAARGRALAWVAAFGLAVGIAGNLRVAEDGGFWRAHSRALIRGHGAAIMDGARTDDLLWLHAVTRPHDAPLMRLADALAARDRAPRTVLELCRYRAFGSGRAPLGYSILTSIARHGEPAYAWAAGQCADLGAWLADRDPPFFTAAAPWDGIFTELSASGRFAPPALPPDGYLGAAVLLAAFAEHSPPGDFAPAGAFTDLAPYLHRAPGDLPDLPVPARFQDLFRQWARGEVGFVEPPR